MTSISNLESRRAVELVAAFQQHEITLTELSEEAQPLSSETLYVVASFLACEEADRHFDARLLSAKARCRQLAVVNRCLS
jgi:hypothetical protein